MRMSLSVCIFSPLNTGPCSGSITKILKGHKNSFFKQANKLELPNHRSCVRTLCLHVMKGQARIEPEESTGNIRIS